MQRAWFTLVCFRSRICMFPKLSIRVMLIRFVSVAVIVWFRLVCFLFVFGIFATWQVDGRSVLMYVITCLSEYISVMRWTSVLRFMFHVSRVSFHVDVGVCCFCDILCNVIWMCFSVADDYVNRSRSRIGGGLKGGEPPLSFSYFHL